MNAKDFPLVGGIIEGIEIYRSVTYRIVSERTRFVANLLPLDQNDLHLSMKYFEAGIAAGLLYLVPFFVAHDQSASKFVFILQQLVGIAIYTLFAYGTFRLLKVTQASFSKLITIMGFWWGFIFLLNFIVMIPVLFFIGPDFLYSGADNSWAYKLDRNILLISSLVAVTGGIVGVALFLYLVLPWLSNTFGISKKRAISGLILAGIPSGFIIAFILGPVARSFEQFLGNWLIIF